MIQKENAIKKAEEDLLGRGKFVERISESIVSYNSDENLIIGLEGKWGSGKTSILNLIEENLKGEVEIFRFSPWNFISRKQLVSDFFDQFSYFLGDSRHEFKLVSECLKKLAYLLKPVKYYPGVAGDFAKMLESALDSTGEFLTKELNFEKIKEKINKILLENDKKIIVMIDDIDRLSDNEIIEIFQLVKGAGEFKKVIYILAYDHELVKNSLDIISKNRGQEYLEKIVQIQIEVPTVGKKYLEEKFISELENIFSGKHLTSEFNLFYKEIIKQEIVDIRKLEKILNNIRFGMDYAKKYLNLGEYILLKTLKVTNIECYNKIVDNLIPDGAFDKIPEDKKQEQLENRILIYFYKTKWSVREKGIRSDFSCLESNRRLRSIIDIKYRDLYFNYF